MTTVFKPLLSVLLDEGENEQAGGNTALWNQEVSGLRGHETPLFQQGCFFFPFFQF